MTRAAQRLREERYRATDKGRATSLARSIRRADWHRAYTDAIKLERGCVDCGFDTHPAALHFDHQPGHEKFRPVSQMATYSRARVDAEIAKCEVRCANCHAIRHHQGESSGSN